MTRGAIRAAVAYALVALLAAHAQAKPAKGAAAKAAPDVQASPAGPALEPKALDVLKAMSARLAGAKSMTFNAVSTYESPSRFGPPLAYTTLSEVALQRPDKLRVVTPADGPASEFYYDGKTMTAFAPAENLAAVAPAPATIDAALKVAYESAAIYFPFTDVLVSDPYADISTGLKRAFYIGQSKVVGATTTDILAIVNDRVFAQLWIGAEDHLPRMVRAVYLDDPSRLRQQVEFSSWHLDAEIPADAFAAARAAEAKRIPFARPDPLIPPGIGPAGKPGSSSKKKS